MAGHGNWINRPIMLKLDLFSGPTDCMSLALMIAGLDALVQHPYGSLPRLGYSAYLILPAGSRCISTNSVSIATGTLGFIGTISIFIFGTYSCGTTLGLFTTFFIGTINIIGTATVGHTMVALGDCYENPPCF